MKKLSYFLFVLSFLCFSAYAQPGLTCLDQQNKPVDWWIILKLPKHTTPLTSGYSYLYTDAANQFTPYDDSSSQTLDKQNQALGYTINQMYKATKSQDPIGWVIYNDAPAEKGNSKKQLLKIDPNYEHFGHIKGVIAFGKYSGFWLDHSVPQFPLPASGTSLATYKYPDTGVRYGQSMLCLSLPTTEFNKIGTQLQYSNPDIYDAKIPSGFARMLPNLINAVNKTGIVHTLGDHTEILHSLFNKSEFTSIVQSDPIAEKNDYFYQFIANNNINQNLFANTWLNGTGKVGPKCDQPKKVNDILTLTTNKYAWKTTQDHSKWAVSEPGGDTVCMGDLNRMESQRKRGGGTICFSNPRLHVNFYQFIGTHTSCSQ